MALPILLAFFFVFCHPCSTSSASIASEQLKFWSQNVHANMPETILSKLSPLTEKESDYFTSLLVSKQQQSFRSDAKFCSAANLACTPRIDVVHPLARVYKVYHVSDPSQRTMKADPFSFFRLSALKEGNTIHLSTLQAQFPDRAFLPSQIASKIPLDLNALQKIFPQSFASPATKETILSTLLYCNSPAIRGEIKSCPRSLEEMIEFSKSVLGQKKPLIALTSKSTAGSGSELVIGNIKKVDAKKIVSCHEVFLPFATHFCHLLSSTSVYAVDLMAKEENRLPVNSVLAVCHMDTSQWPADHMAFKLLQTSPGKSEACHWVTKGDIMWISDETN